MWRGKDLRPNKPIYRSFNKLNTEEFKLNSVDKINNIMDRHILKKMPFLFVWNNYNKKRSMSAFQ